MQQIDVIKALGSYSFSIGYAVASLIKAGEEDEQEYSYLDTAKIAIKDYLEHYDKDATIYSENIPFAYQCMIKSQKYRSILLFLAEEGRTRTGKTDLVNLHKALALINKAIKNKPKQEIKKAPEKPSINSIIDKTTELFGFSLDDLKSRRTTTRLSYAREYLSHELKAFGLTQTKIGDILHRSHCTIILYLDHYEDDFKYNQELKKIITK